MIWIYDGSFVGFLSAVVKSYHEKTLPEILTKTPPDGGLFDEIIEVINTPEDVAKLSKSIRTQLGKTIEERIFHTFLCDDVPFENDLLRYIRLGLKDPANLTLLSHPIVYAIESYQRRVLRALHKMNAYLRFETLDEGTLYAKIAPACNTLPLMGKSFKNRLRNEKFIIHDLKRSLALIYDGQELHIHNVHAIDLPQHSSDELYYQHLWKRFFDSVAITERLNPKLQKQHVPLYYRDYMCEFKSAKIDET